MSEKWPASRNDDPYADETPAEDVRGSVNRRADELMKGGLYNDQAEAQRAAWQEHGDREH